tara:strand:+ start:3609 stop:4187 length:579 start_codon:yes stop_codon:yes gene_type:complete
MAMEMEEDITVEETPEMDQDTMSMFDGPIPGASLTTELGAEPHEKPPVYTDPDEAYEFLMNKIQSPEAFKRLMISAKLDIPVELTVRAVVFSGWALGQYTHDVMLLIFGPVFDGVLDLLEENDIPHIALAERAEDDTLEEAMQELEKYEKFKSGEDIDSEMVSEEVSEEPEEKTEEEPEMEIPDTGLMGRRE